MEDLNYKSNSDKSKTNRVPIPKVVSGKVEDKQYSKMGKLARIFIAEDVSNVKDYVWNTVLIPMIKKALVSFVATGSDLITNSFSMLVNGTPAHRPASSGTIRDYDKCFVSGSSTTEKVSSYNGDANHLPTKDLTFEFVDDANATLYALNRHLNEYGVVTMGDLYDAVGKSTSNWQVHNVGWTDLSSAYVQKDSRRGGWVLYLPEIKNLKR